MISKSKLLWDSRWHTLEIKLFTSVREILGITLKHDKRFLCWFTYPIQSHNVLSYMSYHRLSWFTLSLVEWWVRWRRGTCHLPVFLLRVPISLLASKCLAWQSPTPDVVIHFRQAIPHNSNPKSPLCAYSFQKGQSFSKTPFEGNFYQGGHGVIFLKKWNEKKKGSTHVSDQGQRDCSEA